MKKNIHFQWKMTAVALALLMTTVSCSDMLDMPSKTAYEAETVFPSVDRAEMAVIGIYPNFKDKSLVNYMTPDNDETSSTLSGNERAGLARYTFSAGNNQMVGVLNKRYKAINSANECIEGIAKTGKMQGDTEEAQKYRALYGEALTLRAWAYHDVIRYYGDVPFPLTPSKAGENFNLPRTSKDIIYDQILSDLEEAADYVPWQWEVSYHERVTKGAVYGFMARIALHAAGYSLRWDLETNEVSSLRLARRDDANRIKELYEMARDACSKVMAQEGADKHGVISSYLTVFQDLHNKTYNAENIFELGNYGVSANDDIGYSMGLSIGGANPNGYLNSGTLVRIVPSFYYSFDEEDVRRDITCANYSLASTTGFLELTSITNLGCGKWRKSWQKTQGPSSGSPSINWVMIRYTDILLMYAETENELNGPTVAAKNALKKVRNRAFAAAHHAEKVEAYVDALNTKEAFFQAIFKERSWELAAESNMRRTDLVRWNLLGTTLAETKETLNKMQETRTHPYTGEPIKPFRFYKKQLLSMGTEPMCSSDFIEVDGEIENVVEDGKIVSSKLVATETLPEGYTSLEYLGLTTMDTFNSRLALDFTPVKTELMPLTQSLIDSNSALRNAQHPAYK